MKNLQCKLTRKRWMEIGVSVLLFVLIIAWALVLEYTEPDREATAARKRYFAVARVTDILDDNAETQDWTRTAIPATMTIWARKCSSAASASSILRSRF